MKEDGVHQKNRAGHKGGHGRRISSQGRGVCSLGIDGDEGKSETEAERQGGYSWVWMRERKRERENERESG